MHVHAADARHDSGDRVDGGPADHAVGRSRGGWGTKTHMSPTSTAESWRSGRALVRTGTARS